MRLRWFVPVSGALALVMMSSFAQAEGFSVIKMAPPPQQQPSAGWGGSQMGVQPSGQNGAQPGGSGAMLNAAGEDDPAAEVMRNRQQMLKAYEQVNTSNPMSTDFNAVQAMGVQAPTGPMAELAKLMQNPMVKGYMKLFQDPALVAALNFIMNHPDRQTWMYAQAGLVLFMIVFRAWRQSKRDHWFGKMWVSFYSFCLGTTLSVAVLPGVIFGMKYLDLLQGVFRVLMQ